MGPKQRISKIKKKRRCTASASLCCQLCTLHIRAENLKRHLSSKHSNFINHRAKEENLDFLNSVQATYYDHIVEDSTIPATLLDWHNQSKISSFFKPEEKSSKRVKKNGIEEKNNEVKKNEDAEQPKAGRDPDLVKEVKEEKSLDEEISQNIDPGSDETSAKINEKEASSSIKESDFTEILSTPKICNACKQIIHIKDASRKKGKRQLKLHDHCLACERVNMVKELFLTEAMKALDECKCTDDKCCCKITIEDLVKEIVNKLSFEKCKENTEPPPSQIGQKVDFDQHFFSLADQQGESRWFCSVCYKYSHKTKVTRSITNDWAVKGWKNPNKFRLHQSMKLHLDSKQHSKCKSIHDETLENPSLEADFPFKDLQEKCTENLCIAGLFMALNYLPGRFYTELVEFIDKILSNIYFGKDFTHPVGNRHQSKMASCIAQIAAFESITDVTRRKNEEINPSTGIGRRFSLACDKGTAPNDRTQQVIIETHINSKGKQEERLITAAVCDDPTANGAATQFKTHVEKAINCSNIAAICTDGASVYVGHESGMISRLRKKFGLGSKLVQLPDLNHKIERLLFHNKPKWFIDALSLSGEIVSHIRQHPTINRFLTDAQAQTGKVYHAVKSMVQTRFTEYGSQHIQSVLKNIEVFLEGLPNLLNSGPEPTSEYHAIRILNLIGDRRLIAQLLLMDNVFVEIGKCEKQAQSEDFSPFDYVHIIYKLKSVFQQELHKEYENVINLLENGRLQYTYTYNNKKYEVNINLDLVQTLLNKYWKPSRDSSTNQVIPLFRKWISDILDAFDDFLVIPPAIELSYNIFCDSKQKFEDKVTFFRKIFNMVNTEFKICSESCSGPLSCSCVHSEFSRFWDHYIRMQKNAKPEGHVAEFLKFYMNNENAELVDNLQIINVVRAIEITLLLKATQSNTERVMSVVSQIVKGRFESVYKLKKPGTYADMVNIQTVLKLNGDFQSFDSSLARQKFLGAGHLEALMSTKSKFKKSKTLYTKKVRKPVKKKPKLHSLLKEHIGKTSDIYEQKYQPKGVPSEHKEQSSTDDEDRPLDDFLDNEDEVPLSNVRPNMKEQSSAATIKENVPVNVERVLPEAEAASTKSERNQFLPPRFRYCTCKTTVEKGPMIECENRENCLFYLKQKQTTGQEGGNWFHIKCVNLQRLTPQEMEELVWFCKLCELQKESAHFQSTLPPKEMLKDFLKKENRKLVQIDGDGNCMYKGFSVDIYGTPHKHAEIRFWFCSEFKKIYEENLGRWSFQTCPKEDECKDPVMHFIHKVVAGHRPSIESKYDTNVEISEANIMKYIKKKTNPATYKDSSRTFTAKYGGNIEMELFSLLYKKNIWCLKPVFHDEGTKYKNKIVVTGYRWELTNTFVFRTHKEHVEDSNYATFLYEDLGQTTDVAHYTVVAKIDDQLEAPLPKCRTYTCSPTSPKICNHCSGSGIIETVEIIE